MNSETKREIFNTLLGAVNAVFVYYVPGDGVVVPSTVHPAAPFMYGLNLPKPIKFYGDFEEGIGAELSFGGVKQYTFLPWARVRALAVTGEEGCLVHFQVKEEAERPAPKKSEPVKMTTGKKRSHLYLVK